MKCVEICKEFVVECPNKDCRYYIDYPFDLNCSLIAVEKHGPMILKEVGKRMHVTPARIKQVESQAIKKIQKSKSSLNILQ